MTDENIEGVIVFNRHELENLFGEMCYCMLEEGFDTDKMTNFIKHQQIPENIWLSVVNNINSHLIEKQVETKLLLQNDWVYTEGSWYHYGHGTTMTRSEAYMKQITQK